MFARRCERDIGPTLLGQLQVDARRCDIDQFPGRVAACIAELPERRREAVALHLQGFSLREIGELGGVTEEAARKLLDRGMQTLRERLARYGFGNVED